MRAWMMGRVIRAYVRARRERRRLEAENARLRVELTRRPRDVDGAGCSDKDVTSGGW
jgi:hypothetical protein